jgi:hypothetical protein
MVTVTVPSSREIIGVLEAIVGEGAAARARARYYIILRLVTNQL